MAAGGVAISNLSAAGTGMLMNKARSSRGATGIASRGIRRFAALLFFASACAAAAAVQLSREDTLRIGKKVWQNECGGTVAGLTSWNAGENFASLGIGHFIWYPKGISGPFDESFPKFVRFVAARRAPDRTTGFPKMLDAEGKTACPWNSQAEFLKARNSPEMNELRKFLANSIDLQAAFLVERLQQALPKMLAEAPPAERAHVQRQFDRVASSPMGCYALVDYVNFKGEGVLATERYAGQGWGLLQVLAGMPQENAGNNAVKNFADSAKKVLTNRVRNSPPARNESRWLPGWLARINTYLKG
jgi:hypothetical protein